MAFRRNTLIARPGYSGVGGFWDSLASGFATGVTTQAQTTSQIDLQTALAAQQSTGIGTYLVVGGVALAAILLLKKKKR